MASYGRQTPPFTIPVTSAALEALNDLTKRWMMLIRFAARWSFDR